MGSAAGCVGFSFPVGCQVEIGGSGTIESLKPHWDLTLELAERLQQLHSSWHIEFVAFIAAFIEPLEI